MQHTGHFQELNKRLLISNDCYVRTTSDLHKQSARRLWQICAEKDDVYLGKYEVRKGKALSLCKIIKATVGLNEQSVLFERRACFEATVP